MAFRAISRVQKSRSLPSKRTSKVKEALAEYRARGEASPIFISNCVATSQFEWNIDIRKVAWLCYGELDPSTFAAAKFRMGHSNSRALVFSSGKVVCTGAASVGELLLSVQELQIMINKVHPGNQCLNTVVQNIVSTAWVGGNIALIKLHEFLLKKGICDACYTPELFPGLRFSAQSLRADLPKVKVIVFSIGNIVLTGGKKMSDITIAYDYVKELLPHFFSENKISHKEIISQINEKRSKKN